MAAVLMAALSHSNTASAVQRTSLVVWVEGANHDAIRAQVVTDLGKAYAVTSPIPLFRGLAKEGSRGPVGPSMRDDAKRAVLVRRLERAAASAHVDKVVLVSLEPGSAATRVLVLDTASASAGFDVIAGVDKAEVSDAIARKLGSASTDAPAPEAAPEPVAAATPAPSPAVVPAKPRDDEPGPGAVAAAGESSPDRAATPSNERGHFGRNALELSLGGEFAVRQFQYNEGLTSNLRSYELDGAPAGVVEAGLYPFAFSGGSGMGDVGVVGSYARALGLRSDLSTGTAYDTDWERFFAGARARWRLTSDPDASVLAADAGYGEETFSFGANSLGDTAPDVDYRFVRLGGDARFPFGRFALSAGASYLAVLSAGGLAGRFPQSQVGGIDATLGASLTIVRGLEARIVASYRRFFYAMHPTPGDGYVAGGALDQLGGLQGSLAYAY